jgi:hypothetical protein
VLLHPSVIEQFAVSAPGLSGSVGRTLRTNLRFLARTACRVRRTGPCTHVVVPLNASEYSLARSYRTVHGIKGQSLG